MPIPIDTRKKPKSVKIHVSSGAGADIIWADGHTSHYDFDFLRDHCPCALCDDERKKKAVIASTVSNKPAGLGAALPMFKPKPRARSAAAVGNYAVQIVFTDGHATGIFSFEYLREICPCDACRAEFQT
jgi:DUF971 family protein